MFAQVVDNLIEDAAKDLPRTAARLDTGEVVSLTTVEMQEACGWFPVTTSPQPNQVGEWEFSVDAVNGFPVQVWRKIATAEEVEVFLRAEKATNLRAETIYAQARISYQNNEAFLDSTPTNAQALSQINALTRQINALIKLVAANDLI